MSTVHLFPAPDVSLFLVKIYFVPPITNLGRDFTGEFDRAGRANGHARLLAAWSALFTQIRRVGAEIALLRVFVLMIPHDPARYVRTCLNTLLAADALLLIYRSNVAVLPVDMKRSGWASFQTRRIGALPALDHLDVIRERAQAITQNLDSGQREVDYSLVREGASGHTTCASGTLFRVNKQVSFGVGNDE